MNNKPTPQKSAFLIELHLRKVEKVEGKPADVKTHDMPLLILSNYSEVIEFLSRYSNAQDYYQGDFLQFKWELKDACFSFELKDWNLLMSEIFTDEPYGMSTNNWMKEYFPEHSIHVHRLPLGIHKRLLRPDYY